MTPTAGPALGLTFLLSREIGKVVRSDDGSQLGRVHDLTVRIGAPLPMVHRLVVGGRRQRRLLVPWTAVSDLDPASVRLGARLSVTGFDDDSDLEHDELLLRRDVLDTQIFDAGRHRMTRVSDVLLTLLPDDRLEVAAVEVGTGAVLRRLGLTALGNLMRQEAVDWRDLHLTSERGHDTQLATTAAAVHRLDAHALAELLTELDLERAHEVIRTVGPERAAEAVTRTHPDVRVRLLPALDSREAGSARSGVALRPRRFLRLAGWRRHRPPLPAAPGSSESDDLGS
jgi:hypothetical protein